MRYALFAGSEYYPSGGAWDFIRLFDSLNTAMAAIPSWEDPDAFGWAHIADVEDGMKVVRWWGYAPDADAPMWHEGAGRSRWR